MKKLFFAVVLTAAIATSAFAADIASYDASKVNYKVLNTFNLNFKSASSVNWIIKSEFTKAIFSFNGIDVEAFFDNDGELFGVSRKINFENLPLNAIEKIKSDYKKYSVTTAIEFEHKGEKNYYVYLNDGKHKKLLVVSLYGTVSKFEGLSKD